MNKSMNHKATAYDLKLLKKHGFDGLNQLRMFRIVGRLRTTEKDAARLWNSASDAFNQWDTLGLDEKIEVMTLEIDDD